MALHWTHMGNYMGPIWATHMGPYGFCPPFSYGSHVGSPYGSQILHTFSKILPTFLPSRARYGVGPPVLKGSHVCCPIGVPDLSYKQHCINSRVTNCNVVTSWNEWDKMSFLDTMKIGYWLKMFLENINISFIKTIMNPLYDVDKYVLCKRLNIHLYL